MTALHIMRGAATGFFAVATLALVTDTTAAYLLGAAWFLLSFASYAHGRFEAQPEPTPACEHHALVTFDAESVDCGVWCRDCGSFGVTSVRANEIVCTWHEPTKGPKR